MRTNVNERERDVSNARRVDVCEHLHARKRANVQVNIVSSGMD